MGARRSVRRARPGEQYDDGMPGAEISDSLPCLRNLMGMDMLLTARAEPYLTLAFFHEVNLMLALCTPPVTPHPIPADGNAVCMPRVTPHLCPLMEVCLPPVIPHPPLPPHFPPTLQAGEGSSWPRRTPTSAGPRPPHLQRERRRLPAPHAHLRWGRLQLCTRRCVGGHGRHLLERASRLYLQVSTTSVL